MSGRQEPKFQYLIVTAGPAEHWVMAVHDDTPEWYRRVCSFANRQRADDYAQMENDFRPGGDGGVVEFGASLLQGREGDDLPAPAAIVARDPQSALKPGELVRRSTVMEHTRVERHEALALIAAPTLPEYVNVKNRQKPSETVENPAESAQPAVAAEEIEYAGNSGALPDAATLDVVTEKQAKVFAALWTTGGKPMVSAEIRKASGFANVEDSLSALKHKGYIKRLDVYPQAWQPIARGVPKSDEFGLQSKPWSEAESAAVKALQVPDTYKALAERIGRSEVAVIAHARVYDCYRHELRNGVPDVVATADGALPAVAADADDDGPLTPDDLSTRQQIVLKMMATRLARGDDPFDDKVLLDGGIGSHDLAVILVRLRDFGCIVTVEGTGWAMTDLGAAIAGKIVLSAVESAPAPAHAAPPQMGLKKANLSPKAPKAETRVSYPVVRKTVSPAAAAHADRGMTSELMGDPGAGKSALSKRDALAELKIVEYLDRRGHQVREYPSGTQFMIDGKICQIKETLELVNKYRAKAELAPIDVGAFS